MSRASERRRDMQGSTGDCKDDMQTYGEVAAAILKDKGPRLSAPTVRKYCKLAGFREVTDTERPYLTDENIKTRVLFYGGEDARTGRAVWCSAPQRGTYMKYT